MPEAKEKQNANRDITHASAHHVLVVDDDMCIRKGLKIRLEGAGYKVSTAGNGTEGIMIFDENGALVAVVLDRALSLLIRRPSLARS